MRRTVFALFAIIALSFSPTISRAVELGGLDQTAATAGIQSSSPVSPGAAAGRIISQVLSFVGVLFLGLMLWAGLLWMTAAGNEDKVKEAKKIIMSALVGLIIIAAAYAITQFVGQSLIGTPPSTP